MSRNPRYLPPEGMFHLLARGNNRAEVFHRPQDYYAYLAILRRLLNEFPISMHHYCLMPNHVHLLISVGPQATALSDCMHRLQMSYAIYYKAQYEHVGHLWQDRFRSLWVESEPYFWVCAAYIELNPVAAGLVGEPHEYPFSSYAHYAMGAASPHLTPHRLYAQLGQTAQDRQRAYRALVSERMARRPEDQMTVGFAPGHGGRPKKGTGPHPSPFAPSGGA